MKRLGPILLTAIGFSSFNLSPCLWDSQTLRQERQKSPELADAILGDPSEKLNYAEIYKRIAALKEEPRTNEPTWWSDLAGAYVRLGKPERAVELLEPLRLRFPDDYAVHAN